MRLLNPEELGPPVAAFSHGVEVGDLVFVAGQAALGSNWEALYPRDIAAQTRHVIRSIELILKSAGATLKDVVSTTVYLSSYDNYAEYNRTYAECFGTARPARATVRADLVNPELLVEIQAVACKGSGS